MPAPHQEGSGPGLPVDYEIVSLDARNHGLSPHTPTHRLADLAADLGAFLNTTAAAEEPPCCTIGVGHSMGSQTIAHYLMQRQALETTTPTAATTATPRGSDGAGTEATERCPAELLQQPIDAFVSIDMPPITGAEMSPQLHADLVAMMRQMEAVNLDNIVDMRSAHDEFLRCGMADVRVRGLSSTNLKIPRGATDGQPRPRTHWKCNLPVLQESLRGMSLFFRRGFESDRRTFAHPITEPVLSLLGGASPIGGRAEFQRTWATYAADLEQHIIPAATHTVFFDKPEDTASLIWAFLQQRVPGLQ